MNEELFFQIVMALISIVGALITAFVIPVLKAKFTSDQLTAIENFIEKAVRCAEQIYTPEEWQVKKNFVTNTVKNFIDSKTDLRFTDEQIDTLIEGIVNAVKKGGA